MIIESKNPAGAGGSGVTLKDHFDVRFSRDQVESGDKRGLVRRGNIAIATDDKTISLNYLHKDGEKWVPTGESSRAQVTSLRQTTMATLSSEDAELTHHGDLEALKKSMNAAYSNLKPNEPLTVIAFSPVADVPVRHGTIA